MSDELSASFTQQGTPIPSYETYERVWSTRKCVFTKIYFNKFPKGGTSRSRRPLAVREMCASKHHSVFYLEYQKDVHKNKSMRYSEQVWSCMNNLFNVTRFCELEAKLEAISYKFIDPNSKTISHA